MKLKPLAVGIAFAVAGIAVIGAVVWAMLLAPAGDVAIKYVPPDAVFYANVFLDPSNGQKMALQDLFERFPVEGEREDLLDAIEPALDGVVDDVGLEFREDVRPWLGSQVAMFLTDFEPQADGAVLIATKDRDAALDAVEKIREHEGDEAESKIYKKAEYGFVASDDSAMGVVEDFLVAGTQDAFKSVVDAFGSGDSLEGADAYRRAVRGLAEDRLALVYADLLRFPGFATGAVGAVAVQGLPVASFQPVSASILYARSDALVLESSARVPKVERAEAQARRVVGKQGLLNEMPAVAWAAFGLPNFAETFRSFFLGFAASGAQGASPDAIEEQFRLQTGIDVEKDLLSWMGQAGLFVSGTSPGDVRGALVIESKNPRRTIDAIARLGALLQQSGQDIAFYPASAGLQGFVVRQPPESDSEPIYVLFDEVNERALVTYGQQARLEAVSPDMISARGSFKKGVDALGDDFTPTGYVDVPAVITLLENFEVVTGDTFEQEVQPLLRPISHIAFGSRLVNDTVLQRVVIGLE